MKLYFATHNEGKLKEFKAILSGICEVEQLPDEYVEIQSDDPEAVVKESVQKLSLMHRFPVVAEDSGLFIEALHGFPGVYSAPIHKQIGLSGILKLLEGKENRKAEYRSAVGYCEPGEEPISFLGVEKGTIALASTGDKGFGHDPIFIPEGKEQTYGELGTEGKAFRRKAIEQLMRYLQ